MSERPYVVQSALYGGEYVQVEYVHQHEWRIVFASWPQVPRGVRCWTCQEELNLAAPSDPQEQP